MPFGISDVPNAPPRHPTLHVRLSAQAFRHARCPGDRFSTDGWGRPLWVQRPMLLGRPDGRADLIATAVDAERVAAWALSFGSHLQIESPPRVRTVIRRKLLDLWMIYGAVDCPGTGPLQLE